MSGRRSNTSSWRSIHLAARLSIVVLAVCIGGLAWAAPPQQVTEAASTASDQPTHGGKRRLLLKLKSEGSHAVEACAQEQMESGRPFAEISRDGSDSLDRIHERFRPNRMHALFRAADGRPLHDQRESLRDRLRRRIESRRASRIARDARSARGSMMSRSSHSPSPDPDALPDLSHVYLAEFDSEEEASAALEAYREDAHVEWVQIDGLNALDAMSGPDTYLNSSGAWGQPYADMWGLHRIRGTEAWPISRGAGVVVAVVDTGLDYDHPDIAANVWFNLGEDANGNGRLDPADFNGIDDDGNGFIDDVRGFDFSESLDENADGDYLDPGDISDNDPFDVHGHGTHVAGTIAAVADNGIGIAGVAPDAQIMPIKGFTDDGIGFDSVLWRGVLYAAENGATVINNSWSCRRTCPVNPLAEEIVAIVRAMDVVIVTSAGNSLDDVAYKSPEQTRGVITVSSIGEDDAPSATFTNRGFLVDVSAPGGDPPFDTSEVRVGRKNILSLLSSADESQELTTVGTQYSRRAGTSMSSPHVAGVVALLQSLDPTLDFEAIRAILRSTGRDLGAPGHDRDFGSGVLDAFAALTHPPLQDATIELLSPRQVRTFRPQDGNIDLRGKAAGRDLLRFRVLYGRGTVPKQWTELVDSAPGDLSDDLLGVFPASELDEGAYVIRFEGELRDGSILEEFLLLSLERNRPTRLSSMGPPIGSPQIRGGRILWHSQRDSEGLPAEDQNILATNRKGRRERVITEEPADQQFPASSKSTIAWLDARSGEDARDLYACRVRGRRTCESYLVAMGPFPKQPPVMARGFIYWIGNGELHACRPHESKHRCDPINLGLTPANRASLYTDGKFLTWFRTSPSPGVEICKVDRETGTCVGEPTQLSIRPSGFSAASRKIFAWTLVGPSGEGNLLLVCGLSKGSNECKPTLVEMPLFSGRPEVSGNRLAFESHVGDEDTDVFFCEFDALLRQCPVQRVTADATPQVDVSVDRDRLVWADERDGQPLVYGIGLPSVKGTRAESIREGDLLLMPLTAQHPDGARIDLRIDANHERSAEELGIEIRSPRGRRGEPGKHVLRWRPGFDQAGDYVLSVIATTEGGLYSRESFRVTVRDRERRPHMNGRRPRGVLPSAWQRLWSIFFQRPVDG